MAFLRFVLSKRHPDSGVEEGIFAVAYALRDAADVSSEHRQSLRDELAWFETNLATPERFNRSRSKGYYRRKPRGIAWFRDSADACIARMHELRRIAEIYGHHVEVIHEERLGYIVYEDPFQVVAEPFSETRTGRRS